MHGVFTFEKHKIQLGTYFLKIISAYCFYLHFHANDMIIKIKSCNQGYSLKSSEDFDLM